MKIFVIPALAILFLLSGSGTAVSAQIEGGAIASIDEPAEGSGGGPAPTKRYSSPSKTPAKDKRSTGTAARRVAVTAKAKGWSGPVIGDKYSFLNFEVISAERPYHTRAAQAGGASGLVQVEVLVETDGSVLSARARTGNHLLHAEAERAALASRFNRPTVNGRPARALGFLVYRFGPREEEE